MSTPTKTQFGAALTYVEGILGGPVTENESSPSISSSVGQAVNGNGDRVGLIIVNLGAGDVYIALAADVSSSKGIKLVNSGGNMTLNVRDDLTLCTRAWQAICPAGGPSTLYVLEYLRF